MKPFSVIAFLAFSLSTVGCGSTSPNAPSATPAAAVETLTTVTYAINIPNRVLFQELLTQYPQGRLMAPMTAQQAYDYTSTYRVPNVYFGPMAPPTAAYALAGIVVAPVSVASQDSFLGAEWPNEYGQFAKTRYQWLGRFVYTIANCETAGAVAECRR